MLSRPLIMTGMLGAAVAAPIAMTEGPKHLGSLPFGQPAASDSTQLAKQPAMRPPTIESPEGPGGLIYQSPAPLEGVGFLSVGELLRMDVSKEWVYGRWARKSTGLADPGLFGIRVPVVTGTSMTDLAGSMSYYFNSGDQVDRLRFHGRTADTSALVSLVQNTYGLRPQPSLAGERLYRSFEGKQVLSELRVRPEPVLWSTSPHDSFLVDLELNRPGSGRFVEPKLLRPELPPATEPTPATRTAQNPSAEPTEAAEAGRTGAELTGAKRPAFRWPN